MEKTKRTKKSKKTKTTEWLLKVLGYFICSLMLVAGIIATAYVLKIKVVPTKYIIIFDVVYLLCTILFFILQRWSTPGIITKFLAILLTGIVILACYYIDYTYNRVQDMLDVDTKIDNVNVYVLNEDPAQNIEDARDYTFGILSVQDRKNTDKTLANINAELGIQVATAEYGSIVDLIQALYDREVGCVVLNSAYIGFVSEEENYKDFSKRVRSIATNEIETVVETKKNEDYLYNGDKVFTGGA